MPGKKAPAHCIKRPLMKKEAVIAADVGAGSVKIIAVLYDGRQLATQEIKRFINSPLSIRGSLYDDVGHIYCQMKLGFKQALHILDAPVRSIGIDTFGNDFGFINRRGELAGMVYNYRDKRTAACGTFQSPFSGNDSGRYAVTGIANKPVLAYNQLLANASTMDQKEIGQIAAFLMLPDLFGFFLTDNITSEYVISSITGLLDINKGVWAGELLSALPFPAHIFPDIVPSGTRIGTIKDNDLAEFGTRGTEFIKTAGHDSGAAVMAMPSEDAVHIICGSWSLVGIELPSPIINEQTRQHGLSNQGLPFGKVRLEKPLPGLWILQQCLLEWQLKWPDMNFTDVENLAAKEKAGTVYFDIEQPEFSLPGGMTEKIKQYCRQTGQAIPETAGEIAACVYSSLVIKYKQAVSLLERTAGRPFEKIYLLGGGSKDAFLCRLTANATGKQVISGLADASAVGNAVVQLIAMNEIAGAEQARDLVGDSFSFCCFEPEGGDWEELPQHALEIEKLYKNRKPDNY